MGHKISHDIEHVLVLIRHAITSGRAESVIPLIDDVLLALRIRSVERYIWVRLSDAKVRTNRYCMDKRVVFCAWTSKWKVRASINIAAIEAEPFDPIEIASALVLEMKMAISFE